MDPSQLAGYSDAIKRVRANKSPRYHRLEELESWVTCTQYAGRCSWWDDSKPQWERAPCIVYPIVRMAISSNVDLMLGERAFPRFVFTEDNGEEEEGSGSIEESLADLHKISRFRTVCREAFETAQGTGTVCAIYGVRNGRPFGDIVPAKWCEPEFEAGFRVKRLVIQYPYLDERQRQDGSWEVVAMVYRRVIDDSRDIAYKPAEAPEDGATKIKWVEDPDRTTTHGLGFCPVVWYPFMRGSVAVNVIDGKAVQRGITDEIQAHDIARSQWHTNALFSTPQPIEIGVSPEHNPTGDTGRTAVIPTTEHGGDPHPDGNPVRGAFVAGPRSGPARKKGMGHVWRYPDTDTEVKYLEVSGGALDAQKDNVADLRIKLQEALAVVFLDPENIKFAATTSGKALEAIKQKQFDRVDQFREDFRDGFLIPSLEMQIRIAQKVELKIPGNDVLRKVNPDDIEFGCDVQWGSYTAPDFAEQKQIVELIQLSLGGGNGTALIDLKTALQKLQDADLFEIADIDEMVSMLEKAAEEKKAEALEMAQKAPPPQPSKPPKVQPQKEAP